MSSEQMLNELDDSSDFSGFLDFAKVENVHIQLLDAFKNEDTDISSIDELIDSVKFCKDKCEKPDSEKLKGKRCVSVNDQTVEKKLQGRSQATINKKNNRLRPFSSLSSKIYRAKLNQSQNTLWNACLPYMDVQDCKSAIDIQIVSKAVVIVNDIKTHHRHLLAEKKKLKLTQMKLLKTLISKLKRTGMSVKRKKGRGKKSHWRRKKSNGKMQPNATFEYFKGFSRLEYSKSERCREILESLEEKKSCSSTDSGDEATFSGFGSSDDEACTSDFCGFYNPKLNEDAVNGLLSPLPCSTSFKLKDNIPDLKFVFPPLKYSKVTENVQIVKNSDVPPVRKGMKRKNSDSFQVQLTDLKHTVRKEYKSNPFEQPAQELSVNSGTVKKIAKEKGSFNAISSIVDRKIPYSELQSFIVKSGTDNKNPLKIKIIRNAEISDSNIYESHKRVRREIKHPGKYAAYVTDCFKPNNYNFKMLKNRLQNQNGKLNGKFTSDFLRNKESSLVDQEPKISDTFSVIHPEDVKKENTSPPTNVNNKLTKSIVFNHIICKDQIQRPTFNFSSNKKKNCINRNKPIECPSLLKEIKENQIILADKLACLKDMLNKRTGCEVSIRKLDETMNVKHNHLNRESDWSNLKYGKHIDSSAQVSNVAKIKCLNRGNSVLELNRQILKRGITAPCLPTSFPSDDNICKSVNSNKEHNLQQRYENKKNVPSVTTEDDQFSERQKKCIVNGMNPRPTLYSSSVKRDYPYKNVPQSTSTIKPLPKMPTLIPYYSLTSGNINNTVLSKLKLPKLTNAINLQKKSLKADFDFQTEVGLPHATQQVSMDSANKAAIPFDNNSFTNEKVVSAKPFTQDSSVMLTPYQEHGQLPLTKRVKSLGEIDRSKTENEDNIISTNVVNPPILQKQHKCSNCDFVTAKLGVFKRHQLIHSEANFMANAKAVNIQVPKHTSPVKEITPVGNEEIKERSIKQTPATVDARNRDQKVKSLLMPMKDTPMPLLPNERLFLKSWTRLEKLELMWCYYYSSCNVFAEKNVVDRLKSALSKRGKLSSDKISSNCLLKIVFSILSGPKIRAHDLYPIKINAEITARKEHLNKA